MRAALVALVLVVGCRKDASETPRPEPDPVQVPAEAAPPPAESPPQPPAPPEAPPVAPTAPEQGGGVITAPGPADLEWAALQTAVNGPTGTVHERLRLLEAYARAWPNAHVEQLANQLATTRAAVQAELAAQAERAAVFRRRLEEERQARATALKTGSLAELAARVIVDEGKEELPAWWGLGMLRESLFERIKQEAPGLAEAEKIGTNDGPEAVNKLFNALLLARLGGVLLREGSPTSLDPAALQKLLEQVWVPPDATLAGMPAREVYKRVRKLARAYGAVYRVMARDIGHARVLTDYRSALAAHPDTEENKGYNEGLLGFYRTWPRTLGVSEKAGLGAGYHGVNVAVGFWMRRMADGTDRTLAAFLTRVYREYDPEFLQEKGPISP